jgi:serine O-acetyltransferase
MAIQRRSTPRRPHLDLADRILEVADGRARAGFGPLPSSADVAALADDLLAISFFEAGGPREGGRAEDCESLREYLAGRLAALERRLEDAVFLGLHRRCAGGPESDDCRKRAQTITRRVLKALPDIRALLAGDVQAALEGDPAATGADEVIACYPGLYAVAIYRAAHRLFLEGAEVLPRMLTEHAKARSGIDIHPGANIGPSFFIDHGTGIVIGETTDIGRGVRIYQGVTLGALSIKRQQAPDGGKRGRPDKRHPTIEDDVIIYANATILGGETVIGRGAVIGGNAFITYSVPPGIRVGVGR